MTDKKKDNDVSADAGAYVLNALDKHDRDAFDAQLGQYDELRNEVTELNDTAVLLGMAVDPVTPSAGLKESIMSKLATTPQLSRDVPPVRELHPVVDPDAQIPAHFNRKANARWFTRPALALTSAAAAVALLIGGGVAVALVTNGSQQEQQADAVAALRSAPDHQTAKGAISTGGTATLVWSPAQGKAAISVSGLKALPSGKTYELWFIDVHGIPRAAGLFSGTTASRMLDGKMSAGDTVGVTVEPSGGSKSPTTTPIVAIASA
jgi:anti-sigma-K factor RskA